MQVSEKRLSANRRNIELGRAKAKEAMHRIKARNNTLVECTCECKHCHNLFTATITLIDQEKGRFPRFCSRSCANSRVRTKEVKQKVSKTLTGVKFVNGKRIKVTERKCKQCGRIMNGKKYLHRTFCSDKCRHLYNAERKNRTSDGTMRQYKAACAFTFSMKDYPEEFDFALIKRYGWYSAKNYKNNPNGVTRDHMYSIKEGYKNKVSPLLISHPANCKLMRQHDNMRKQIKCSITLVELKERIKKWEDKYGNSNPCISKLLG